MGVQPSTVKTTQMASHLEWLGSLIPRLAHNVPLFLCHDSYQVVTICQCHSAQLCNPHFAVYGTEQLVRVTSQLH